MGLKRQNSIVVWNNYAAAAGEVSNFVRIMEVEFLLIYVSVSAATTITLQVQTIGGWVDYDSLVFTGPGYNFWNIWSLAADIIRFKTSAAATISIQVFYKA
jgi:hypothetical protein